MGSFGVLVAWFDLTFDGLNTPAVNTHQGEFRMALVLNLSILVKHCNSPAKTHVVSTVRMTP